MDNVYTLSMDVLYRYEGLDFVWDVRKAASNIEKHGIRFEQACEVFLDPLARLVDAGVEDEARDALLGEVTQGTLLFVVHIERGERSHPHHLGKGRNGHGEKRL
jgi:uncharacterized DUF497 family protein